MGGGLPLALTSVAYNDGVGDAAYAGRARVNLAEVRRRRAEAASGSKRATLLRAAAAQPEQYYAELSLDEGVTQGDEIFVDLEIAAHDGSGALDITNWKLEVDPAVLISGVDIKILHRPASPNDYRGRATTAGDNYAFKEENEDF